MEISIVSVQSSIDPTLAAKSYSSVAKSLICHICKKVPLPSIAKICTGLNCLCICCTSCNPIEKCKACNVSVKDLPDDLKTIVGLIHFKCPYVNKGCKASIKYTQMPSHVKTCNYSINCSAPTPPQKTQIVKINNFPKHTVYSDSSDDGLFSSEDELTRDIGDKMLKKMSESQIENLTNDTLREILRKRNLQVTGVKDDLVFRLKCYLKKRNNFSDKKLKKMLTEDELDLIKNEDFEEILEIRGLKKSGNKTEKIHQLMKYLIAKKK